MARRRNAPGGVYKAVPIEEVAIPAWAEVAAPTTVLLIEKVLTAIRTHARYVRDAEEVK